MTKHAVLAAASFCLLVAAPAAARQGSPTAHCRDGTYYYGTSRRQACAHHQGVSEWLGPQSRAQLRSAPRPRAQSHKPASRRAPAGATAKCKDGTWSKNPRRTTACAGHGGVVRWLGRH